MERTKCSYLGSLVELTRSSSELVGSLLVANAVTSRLVLRHADGRQLTRGRIDELVASNISTMSNVVKENPSISYFEAFTALAIKHFADSKVDWAIMEAGLGGVMDATNVFKPHQVLPNLFSCLCIRVF